MTNDGSTLLHQHTVFDGWRSITVALYMTLVGYGVQRIGSIADRLVDLPDHVYSP